MRFASCGYRVEWLAKWQLKINNSRHVWLREKKSVIQRTAGLGERARQARGAPQAWSFTEGSGFFPCNCLEKVSDGMLYSKESVSAFFSYFRHTLYFIGPNQLYANLAFLLGLVDLCKDTVKSIKRVLKCDMLIIGTIVHSLIVYQEIFNFLPQWWSIDVQIIWLGTYGYPSRSFVMISHNACIFQFNSLRMAV